MHTDHSRIKDFPRNSPKNTNHDSSVEACRYGSFHMALPDGHSPEAALLPSLEFFPEIPVTVFPADPELFIIIYSEPVKPSPPELSSLENEQQSEGI